MKRKIYSAPEAELVNLEAEPCCTSLNQETSMQDGSISDEESW